LVTSQAENTLVQTMVLRTTLLKFRLRIEGVLQIETVKPYFSECAVSECFVFAEPQGKTNCDLLPKFSVLKFSKHFEYVFARFCSVFSEYVESKRIGFAVRN
jgi:hypothetical protein